jgi:hypothetical protein
VSERDNGSPGEDLATRVIIECFPCEFLMPETRARLVAILDEEFAVARAIADQSESDKEQLAFARRRIALLEAAARNEFGAAADAWTAAADLIGSGVPPAGFLDLARRNAECLRKLANGPANPEEVDHV